MPFKVFVWDKVPNKPPDIVKPKKENEILGFVKDVADFLILDDLNTIADPDASLLSKGIAIVALTPIGKATKLLKFIPTEDLFKIDDLVKSNKVDDVVEKKSGSVAGNGNLGITNIFKNSPGQVVLVIQTT
jgi:hypothetical protein